VFEITATNAPSAAAAPGSEAETGLPDWLSGTGQVDDRDWLRDEAAPSAAETELPDWLRSEAAPSAAAAPVEEAPKGMSGWLRRETGPAAPAAPGGEAETGLPVLVTGGKPDGGTVRLYVHSMLSSVRMTEVGCKPAGPWTQWTIAGVPPVGFPSSVPIQMSPFSSGDSATAKIVP